MVNERNSLLSPHEVTVTGSYLSLLAENQKGYKVEYHVQDLRFAWKITDMFVDSCSAIMGTSREELVYWWVPGLCILDERFLGIL